MHTPPLKGDLMQKNCALFNVNGHTALHGVYVLICQAIFNRLPYMLNIVAAAKKL